MSWLSDLLGTTQPSETLTQTGKDISATSEEVSTTAKELRTQVGTATSGIASVSQTIETVGKFVGLGAGVLAGYFLYRWWSTPEKRSR